jgi:RNA polymerase sigma factor (sigma-70 family)
MAGGSTEAVLLKQLQTLYNVGAIGNLTDGQLLERCTSGCDGAVEAAFAALVERHGPMVLRVCQQVLGDSHDAQDAFQATFLVLVRRADSIRKYDSVASWLYGVAQRVAQRARADVARRRAHERRVAAVAAASVGDGNGHECWPELHEEIAGLPDKYRAAVVLCYLEGLTTEAAARRLGCPQGTVLSRLSRAREQLRRRLTRRGLAVPAELLAVGWAPNGASAAVPIALADATIRAALPYAAGQVSAGSVPASVAALAGTILRTTLMAKIKMTMVALSMLGVVAIGAVGFARQNPEDREPRGVQPAEGTRPVGAPDRARGDKEEIQGTWRVISAQDNGRPIPEKANGGKQTEGLKLLITSDTITFKLGDEIQAKGTYKLDPTKDPKWIDLSERDSRHAPGIYVLQGDELTICYNEAGTERPNKFASEPNTPNPRSTQTPNDVLIMLRREIAVAAGADDRPSAKKESKPPGLGARLLEFRIVADLKHDRAASEQALGPEGREKPPTGYRWVRLESRHDDRYEGAIIREEGVAPAARRYLLVKLDTYNVNEGDLARVYKTEDERRFPAIGFRFKPDGSRRFGDLTRTHLPEDGGLFKYRLAIIVEGAVLSSPFIAAEVRDGAIIELGGMEPMPEEVDRLVKLLNSAVPPDAESTKK